MTEREKLIEAGAREIYATIEAAETWDNLTSWGKAVCRDQAAACLAGFEAHNGGCVVSPTKATAIMQMAPYQGSGTRKTIYEAILAAPPYAPEKRE